MKRLWYIPTLFSSLVVSLILLRRSDLFTGPDTGDGIIMILAAFLLFHLMAFAVGFALPPQKIFSNLALLCIALLPVGYLLTASAKRASYHEHVAVYDRFRDNLLDPIPSSVTALEFIDLDESKETHLMFRFQIDPDDLDQIIKSRGFKRITSDQFRCPIDRFRDPSYLPMKSSATFHTIEEGGYSEPGWGEGYTLKVNATKDSVIFRHESAAYYRYRDWEPNSGEHAASERRENRP